MLPCCAVTTIADLGVNEKETQIFPLLHYTNDLIMHGHLAPVTAAKHDNITPFFALTIALGAVCMVAAVCGATQKELTVVGKPSTFLMDFLQKKYDIPTCRMCMVGDRLDTDILFG
ncbi:hypothetical protein L2E82_28038 [Cichorium intybus]|uniref:Uncharacterized protein n=1 Tax=Cichorium intybus TaxID=13427 RepID=A0ACB9CUY4_CICIN|nr:hypothetical protein L2E82_28038 [Cichorium intybus]